MKACGIRDKLVRMVKKICNVFKRSVLNEEERRQDGSRSSPVLNKVVSCQGFCSCSLSTGWWEDNRRAENDVRCNFTTTLDFADYTVLVLSNYEHIQNKADRLVNNAGREELELHAVKSDENKCAKRNEEVGDVEEFVRRNRENWMVQSRKASRNIQTKHDNLFSTWWRSRK